VQNVTAGTLHVSNMASLSKEYDGEDSEEKSLRRWKRGMSSENPRRGKGHTAYAPGEGARLERTNYLA